MPVKVLRKSLAVGAIAFLAAGPATAGADTAGKGMAQVANCPANTVTGKNYSTDRGAWTFYKTVRGPAATTMDLHDIECDGLTPRLQYRKESGSVTTVENPNGCSGSVFTVTKSKSKSLWPSRTN